MQTIGDLFQDDPDGAWGLRGDPHLWQEFSQIFAETALPQNQARLHRLLENAFWEATGASLAFCQNVQAERLAHGGMSSGMISGAFWRERGFPAIIARFEAARKP